MTFEVEFGEPKVKRRDITAVEIELANSRDRLNEAETGAEFRPTR
jgi:hypothetical protein